MKFNYMSCDNQVLTSVTVNNKTKKVEIRNFTDEVLDRAFGVKENITYDDIVHFFEKRSFPRNRANIDDILKVFHLKSYDPYQMCKKMQGRTEQDNKWIDFIED